jgi:transposase
MPCLRVTQQRPLERWARRAKSSQALAERCRIVLACAEGASNIEVARWCGVAPVAVSSGEGGEAPTHHRLDLAGSRQVNSTLHLMHVTQVRSYPPARDYIAKKRAEHKTKREARRAHKRHLANVVIRRMWADYAQRFETVANPATPAAA